ncbi:MAG: HEAT repeat domain-containing protein [Bryobacteraceae bacterium]
MRNFLASILMIGMVVPAAGQEPMPPSPPLPPSAPVEAMPAPAPAPPLPPMPELELELEKLNADMERMKLNLGTIDFAFDFPKLELELSGMIAQTLQHDKAGLAAQVRQSVEQARESVKKARTMARMREGEERTYRRGSAYLDRREWEKAVEAFDGVIEEKGTRADGAHYWKAYALNKLGRRDEALQSLSALRKSFPSSRWLNDAKALEAEVRQASGQGVPPENQADEDLKLLAINSLINSDPQRAVPMLEKLLTSQSSPKLKERALFVLAQSKSGPANEIVAKIARGAGNPDLQLKAVEYLGIHGGPENLKVLSDVYSSSNDVAVKRQILHAFMVGNDKDRLAAAAKGEANPELRKNAIHWLGTMRKAQTGDVLTSMYASETNKEVKEQILHSLFIQGSVQEIIDLARKEKDAELKREAVQKLSLMKSKEATDYMLELLNK